MSVTQWNEILSFCKKITKTFFQSKSNFLNDPSTPNISPADFAFPALLDSVTRSLDSSSKYFLLSCRSFNSAAGKKTQLIFSCIVVCLPKNYFLYLLLLLWMALLLPNLTVTFSSVQIYIMFQFLWYVDASIILKKTRYNKKRLITKL